MTQAETSNKGHFIQFWTITTSSNSTCTSQYTRQTETDVRSRYQNPANREDRYYTVCCSLLLDGPGEASVTDKQSGSKAVFQQSLNHSLTLSERITSTVLRSATCSIHHGLGRLDGFICTHIGRYTLCHVLMGSIRSMFFIQTKISMYLS